MSTYTEYTYLFIYLSIYLFIHLSIYLYLFIYLSIYFSIYIYIYIFIYIYIYISIFVSIYISLSLSLSYNMPSYFYGIPKQLSPYHRTTTFLARLCSHGWMWLARGQKRWHLVTLEVGSLGPVGPVKGWLIVPFKRLKGVPPLWMVLFIVNPMKMGDFGGTPISGNLQTVVLHGLFCNSSMTFFWIVFVNLT